MDCLLWMYLLYFIYHDLKPSDFDHGKCSILDYAGLVLILKLLELVEISWANICKFNKTVGQSSRCMANICFSSRESRDWNLFTKLSNDLNCSSNFVLLSYLILNFLRSNKIFKCLPASPSILCRLRWRCRASPLIGRHRTESAQTDQWEAR